MKTLVVKIGTSTLIRNGAVDEEFLDELARQIHALRAENWRVVVVTSGAVRVGLDVIGRVRAVTLAEKQAAAAIGQSLLMRAYRRTFERHGLPVAQLLLTRGDIGDRRRFLNARHTMTQLLSWNVVPIVNENDTVATEEIRFGDNDALASLTALVAEADCVLLLSDIDGFYLPDKHEPESEIAHITPEIEAAAGGAGSIGGTGGMKTKIEAARIATQAGIEFVIAHGRDREIVSRVARNESVGTRFLPVATLSGKKRWIAYGRTTRGSLLMKLEARDALQKRGSSLLPIGIIAVEGEFEAGETVSICDEAGEYGRGVSNFSAADLRSIAGQHSSQVSVVLQRNAPREAIHRDNLTLFHPDYAPAAPQVLAPPS